MVGKKTVIVRACRHRGWAPLTKLLMTLMIPMTMTACLRGTGAQQASIVGEDQRVFKADDFDMQATGLVQIPGGPSCNGFLYDTDRVLTTAHCVNSAFEKLIDARFVTNAGKESRIATISFIDESTDVVGLITSVPFDSHYEISAGVPKSGESLVEVRVVGTGGVGQPVTTSFGAAQINKSHQLIEYTADTIKGMSGSVVAIGKKAVGIHLGTTHDAKMNLAMPLDTDLRLRTRLSQANVSFEAWGGWKPPRIEMPKLPDLSDLNPLPAMEKALMNTANSIAVSAKGSGMVSDFDNCVPMVAAGVAAYGAAQGSKGGPWGTAAGAAMGAGGGIHFARIACHAIFP